MTYHKPHPGPRVAGASRSLAPVSHNTSDVKILGRYRAVMRLYGAVKAWAIIITAHPGTTTLQLDVALPVAGNRPIATWHPHDNDITVLPWASAWLDVPVRHRLSDLARDASRHTAPATGSHHWLAAGRTVTGHPSN